MTIRKNSLKRINELLSKCIMIREFKYDDMGDVNGKVTAEQVMNHSKDFDRVSAGESIVRVSIHQNWHFTGYLSVEAARATLTPIAFAKYFN